MDLKDIEDKIITQLKVTITDMAILAFPDVPTELPNLHPGGTIHVRYNGSAYEEPESNRKLDVSQPRRMSWLILIRHKNLFNHKGIYARIDSVRTSLTGFIPSGFNDLRKMWPISDAIVAETVGEWNAESIFENEGPEDES